ncbi:hypothetical protein GW17_00005027 [Ensete ventricosum]|nr:hypothetical protein GW17_00005027 [Ensete ventricosum]
MGDSSSMSFLLPARGDDARKEKGTTTPRLPGAGTRQRLISPHGNEATGETGERGDAPSPPIAEKDSRTNRGERRGDLSEEIDLSFPNKRPASLNRGFGGMWCVTRSRALQFALLPAYANPAPEQAESDRIEACGPTGRNR